MVGLSGETLRFFTACLFGAALGILYDLFRILRLILSPPRRVLFLLDTVYCLMAAVSVFFFLIFSNDGLLRGFLLLGCFAGAAIYRLTASRFVIRIMEVPIRMLHRASAKGRQLFRKVGAAFKKRWKKCLKKAGNLLYNMRERLRKKKGSGDAGRAKEKEKNGIGRKHTFSDRHLSFGLLSARHFHSSAGGDR